MRARLMVGMASTMLLVVLMALVGVGEAQAQRATGQWDFDDANDPFAATIGRDGYVWSRPPQGEEQLVGDPESKTEFGLASEWNVLMPDGDGGVMKFPGYNFLEGIDMYPGIAANGGGSYVNQYTVIYDLYYPESSQGVYRGLLQTSTCNENDSDFFINPDNGIGISGDYDGEVLGDTWHRIAFAVDLAHTEAGDPEGKTEFGLASEFPQVVEFPGGDGGIMFFDVFSPLEGIDLYHGIEANGGGTMVNQYTLIYDIYYPDTSNNSYISFLNNDECNDGDQDLAGRKDGENWWGIGIGGDYVGQIFQNQWHRVIFSIDMTTGTIYRWIDGAPLDPLIQGGLDGRFSMHPASSDIPSILLGDDSGDVDAGYLAAFQVRNYVMDDAEASALGGVDLATNIPTTVNSQIPDAAVTGDYTFDNPADGLAANVGLPLEYYDGTRCFAGGAPAPIVDKYIDGVRVDRQFLSSGVDGRWALYPAADNLPCIVLTDEGGETAAGYCNAIQIRDYAMSEAEVGALGGVSAAGILDGAGVTGDWDFDNAADGLVASTGQNLEWFTAERCYEPFEPGEPELITEFGLASEMAGAPSLPGGDGGIMHFQAYSPKEGLDMYPNAGPNGGGDRINRWTIIYDICFPELGWMGLISIDDPCNGNDAEFFMSSGGGIGISGQYDGEIQPNTWHRIAFAVDQFPESLEIRKYIDGVQVGFQLTGSLDGRWSLPPEDTGLPVLLFTDNNGETVEAYVSSIQLRDYDISDAEAADLGGVTAGNIPTDSGVIGQWDFENPENPLAATTGLDLEWFTGERCLDCYQDLSDVEIGPAWQFFAPDINGETPHVMRWDATIPCTGYLMPHGAQPNGGGVNVNEYTLLMDIYLSPEDYFGPPPGHDASWIALYQTWPFNDGDAMLWIRTADGALGDDGEYSGTVGWISPDQWVRVVAAVDCTNATVTKWVIYEDDSYAEGAPVTQAGDGLDGKRSMWSRHSQIGEDHLLLFADENFETHRGVVNSIQVRNYVMTDDEVALLGGPTAAGIPIPDMPGCPGDMNCDDAVTFDDIELFVGALSGWQDWTSDCPWEFADCNGDGAVDFDDITTFVGLIGTTCE